MTADDADFDVTFVIQSLGEKSVIVSRECGWKKRREKAVEENEICGV
jgi:hypothetical protein